MSINRKDPAGKEQTAFIEILRTEVYLMGAFSQLMKKQGLSEPLFNILRILRGAGRQGLRVQDIRQRMLTRVPDMTRLLDRLEKMKWISRGLTQTDRRVVMIRITPDGLRKLRHLDHPVLRLHQELLGHLSRKDLDQIIQLMQRARKNKAQQNRKGKESD